MFCCSCEIHFRSRPDNPRRHFVRGFVHKFRAKHPLKWWGGEHSTEVAFALTDPVALGSIPSISKRKFSRLKKIDFDFVEGNCQQNSAYEVNNESLKVNQTHPVLPSGRPVLQKTPKWKNSVLIETQYGLNILKQLF